MATTRKPTKKEITFSFPGSNPEKVKAATLAELVEMKNLSDYSVSVNGETVSNDYAFSKGDIVRVALKSKHG